MDTGSTYGQMGAHMWENLNMDSKMEKGNGDQVMMQMHALMKENIEMIRSMEKVHLCGRVETHILDNMEATIEKELGK
jgi:hypothetical protein